MSQTRYDHTKILYNRYFHLLKSIKDVDAIAEVLFNRNLLTQREKADISSSRDKQKHLCQVLTDRGISHLVEISQVLKSNQKWNFGPSPGDGGGGNGNGGGGGGGGDGALSNGVSFGKGNNGNGGDTIDIQSSSNHVNVKSAGRREEASQGSYMIYKSY